MISFTEFKNIDVEVKNAVISAFDYSIAYNREDSYILFLANGEYHSEFDGPNRRVNPYTIDNRLDIYKDESRFRFFIEFMRTYYSFPAGATRNDDNEYRITIEMMVYSHIWESKPFLKQLFKLSALCAKKGFIWNVSVPDMSKHEFIRNEIRSLFKESNLDLADIISKGFHTSLRNAFAHAEYSVDITNSRIVLDTYKPHLSWDIREISFDDWTKKFIYTALLAYHFENEKLKRRKSITKDFGKSEFLVIHPISKNKFTIREIICDQNQDSIYFKP